MYADPVAMSVLRSDRPATRSDSLSSPSANWSSRSAKVPSTVFRLVITSPMSSSRPASVLVSAEVWASTDAMVPP